MVVLFKWFQFVSDMPVQIVFVLDTFEIVRLIRLGQGRNQIVNIAFRCFGAQRKIGLLGNAVRLAVFGLVIPQFSRRIAYKVIAGFLHPALAFIGGVHALVEFQTVDAPLSVFQEKIKTVWMPSFPS